MGAVFVPDGAFAGDILLAQFMGDHTRLQLIDPARVGTGADAVIAEASVPDANIKDWVISTAEPGKLGVTGSDFAPWTTLTGTLNIVTMTPGGAQVRNFLVPNTAYPTASRSSADRFTWSSYEYIPNILPGNNNVAIQVYAADNSQFGQGVISPTLSFSQGVQHTEMNNPLLTPAIVLGDRFFAYTHDNRLHLHSYDGKDDLVLEQGVLSISTHIQSRSFWMYVR